MYEFFDHTADLGLRVEAATREELFAEAARGLTAMIVDDPASIRPRDRERLSVAGTDPVYLLFDWLNELLYRFESRRMLYREFDVRIGDSGLTAELAGEPYDPARHPLQHEVKAITYHRLVLEPRGDRWFAEAVVDI
jgi:SHS2 domain-containing protein